MKKIPILLLISIILFLGGCVSNIGHAIKTKNKAAIESYLNKGQDINGMDSLGRTPLMTAVLYGHLELVEFLIEKGADLNIQSKDGHLNLGSATALHYAAFHGWDAIAEVLIKKGAKLDLQTKKGQTALHLSTYYQFNEIVKLLVEAKANTQLKDKFGFTALDYAAKFNFHRIVDLLKNAQ